MAHSAKLFTCIEAVTGSNLDRPTDYSKQFYSFPLSLGILKKNFHELCNSLFRIIWLFDTNDRVVK